MPQESVKLRYMRLTARMNSFVAIVTGRQSSIELVHPLHAIGITHDMLESLEKMELIAYDEAVGTGRIIHSSDRATRMTKPLSYDAATQNTMRAIHAFLEGFLRPTFGFRGVPLEFDLAACKCLADYHALANTIVINLHVRQGSVPVIEFKAQVERILGPIHWR